MERLTSFQSTDFRANINPVQFSIVHLASGLCRPPPFGLGSSDSEQAGWRRHQLGITAPEAFPSGYQTKEQRLHYYRGLPSFLRFGRNARGRGGACDLTARERGCFSLSITTLCGTTGTSESPLQDGPPWYDSRSLKSDSKSGAGVGCSGGTTSCNSYMYQRCTTACRNFQRFCLIV